MQNEILTRGVTEILPSREGLAKLMEQRKIRLYLGIDPTGNQLHFGHAVVLRKLQQFVDAGHEVILLIGNGTVKIGDPTGRDKTRPVLTDEEIEQNFQTWKQQASKILDFDRITIVHNGDWIDPLRFPDLVKLMSQVTVQQLIERDMFQDRLAKGLPIFLHEILYPVMQGFDSVVMEVDLEIGGNDQLFNMMVGRQMLQTMKGREKFVLGVPLLRGDDGRKMGKSLGNFIPLTASPEDMFGKLMSIVDDVIFEYFELLTDVPTTELQAKQEQLRSGALHPMELKKQLAFILTAQMHDEESALHAQEVFEQVVQRRELPTEMNELVVTQDSLSALDLVMSTNVMPSRSEAKRLIEQGGVELSGQSVRDPWAEVSIVDGDVLRVGKRQFFRIKR